MSSRKNLTSTLAGSRVAVADSKLPITPADLNFRGSEVEALLTLYIPAVKHKVVNSVSLQLNTRLLTLYPCS